MAVIKITHVFLLIMAVSLAEAMVFQLLSPTTSSGKFEFRECSNNPFRKRVAKVFVKTKDGTNVAEEFFSKGKLRIRRFRFCRGKDLELKIPDGDYMLEFRDVNGEKVKTLKDVAVVIKGSRVAENFDAGTRLPQLKRAGSFQRSDGEGNGQQPASKKDRALEEQLKKAEQGFNPQPFFSSPDEVARGRYPPSHSVDMTSEVEKPDAIENQDTNAGYLQSLSNWWYGEKTRPTAPSNPPKTGTSFRTPPMSPDRVDLEAGTPQTS